MTHEENEMLVRTRAGTPMGDLFRSFWEPVALSAEIAEPDGPQVRVKVMGEELLVFRTSDGTPALITPRCAHRGANLFFGRNEAGGIRCAYHGWKFGPDGRCLDMPTIDPERTAALCAKARITAYPARDWGGFVWAYLGRRDVSPPLPQLEFALVPPSHRHVSKKFQECNWAQAAEGAIDTAHFSFLHQPVVTADDDADERAARATRGYAKQTMSADHVRWMREDPRPRFDVRPHRAGLVVGTSRKADTHDRYWRIAQYLMPNHAYTPSATAGQTYHAQTWVPIDDESCWVYVYSWNPDRPLTDDERASYARGGAVYPEMDDRWMPVRHRGNDYLLDRRLQKTENFTGIIGVSEQDAAIQDSQGRIADRTRELLGPTDLGVVQFRRLMLGAAKALVDGHEHAAIDAPETYRVRAGGIVAPKDLPFPDVMQLRFGDEIGRMREATESTAEAMGERS
jgi:phthalate 4,5-dioxygenase oxygenase subunit